MAYKKLIPLFIFVFASSLARISKRQSLHQHGGKCMTPNNSFGTCIPIEECHVITRYMEERKSLTMQETAGIRAYICGTSLSQRKICCPRGEFNLDWIFDDCKTPDQEIGKCKPAQSCAPIVDYIQEYANVNNMSWTEFRKYTCESKTFKSNDPMVCCPFKPIMVPSNFIDVRPKPIDHSRHKNIHLLSSNCGQQSGEDKINNGEAARLYEFPWAVALKLNSGNYDCGGSLINERYILTAAHCIGFDTNGQYVVGVRLGEYNFATDLDCDIGPDGGEYCAPPHQDFEISLQDTIVHTEFNQTTWQNDIALIRLKEAVNFTFAIAPVCLPITISEKKSDITKFTLIGWGETEADVRSNILLQTIVPSQDIWKCQNVTSYFKQLCAGGVNITDACKGDSGGPLLADHIEDGILKYIQYGIVSHGPRICARENLPTTYTNVAAYMEWILDNLKP